MEIAVFAGNWGRLRALLLGTTLILVVLLGTPGTSSPADSAPVAGGSRETVRTVPAGGETGRVNPRLLHQAEQLADRLEQQSETAFNRGLMPVADYADELAVAQRLKVTTAELRQDESARTAALADHAARLNRAAARLEAFHQPNAQGYQAELLHAKSLAAQAEAAVAEARNNRAAMTDAIRRAERFAAKHIEARTADYRKGRATLPQWLRAVSDAADVDGGGWGRSAATPPGSSAGGSLRSTPATPPRTTTFSADDDAEQRVASLKAYQGQLQDLADESDRLAQRGADAGRADRLEAVQFELASLQSKLATVTGDNDQARTAISRADARSQQLFERQLDYYKHGTASLFDLSQSWSAREELHHGARQGGYEVSTSAVDRRSADLNRLTELAERVTDQRGRMSADVTLVRCLGTLDELDRERPAKENAVPQPKTRSTNDTTKADSLRYVIEFKR